MYGFYMAWSWGYGLSSLGRPLWQAVWQQECEAAGRMPCTVRKQGEMDAGAQCPSFHSVQGASPGKGATQLGYIFSLHSTKSRKLLTDTPRIISWVMLDAVKLGININSQSVPSFLTS